MEFKKVIFRLIPAFSQYNKTTLSKTTLSKTILSERLLVNQPIIVFDHGLNKVIGYDNISNDCIKSFDTIFNDIYKSNIQTKFLKNNQFDFNQPIQFFESNQIEHIDIHSKSSIYSKSNIKCYILDSQFIKSSIIIDNKFNIYHQILNSNNTIRICQYSKTNQNNNMFNTSLGLVL